MSDFICLMCGQFKPGAVFDWGTFGLRIRLVMARRNLSYRKAADEIGVDQATLHRVAVKSLPMSAENYMLVKTWLGDTR